MAFDLKREIAAMEKALADLRAWIAEGAEKLRQAGGLAARCDDLGRRLARLAEEVPPPELEPPTSRGFVEVVDTTLVRVGAVRRWVPFGRRQDVDVDGNKVQRVKRRVQVELPEPRFPGADALDIDVEVEVKEADREPAPERGGFRFVLYPVQRKCHLHMDAIPPNAPPTPAQAAYLARKKQIEEEVRDIKTLIARLDREVRDLKDKTAKMEADARSLEAGVAQLPAPVDATARIEAILTQVQAVGHKWENLENELNDYDNRLSGVRAELMQICPELQL